LLEFEPLAGAKLDAIDESLIEAYVQHRRMKVAPASVNRDLATLRRALRLAQDWKLVDRVPRIRMLPGERVREFVLSDSQEKAYLGAAPDPLRDIALLILDTGMRPGEVLALEWPDVRFEPVKGAKLGYIHVRKGKTRNAKRNLSLTSRVRVMLERLASKPRVTDWVFTDQSGKAPLSRFTVRDQHDGVRDKLKIVGDFVVYSLRHTFGTRLGESGADAFTIMRVMGHSTVTVSQRYVHPTPETLERAFERLEERNERAAERVTEQERKATEKLPASETRQLPATISATAESGVGESLPQVA
jgi:integrase